MSPIALGALIVIGALRPVNVTVSASQDGGLLGVDSVVKARNVKGVVLSGLLQRGVQLIAAARGTGSLPPQLIADEAERHFGAVLHELWICLHVSWIELRVASAQGPSPPIAGNSCKAGGC